MAEREYSQVFVDGLELILDVVDECTKAGDSTAANDQLEARFNEVGPDVVRSALVSATGFAEGGATLLGKNFKDIVIDLIVTEKGG